MQYLKSAFSAFYDIKIQPQLGDIFEILLITEPTGKLASLDLYPK